MFCLLVETVGARARAYLRCQLPPTGTDRMTVTNTQGVTHTAATLLTNRGESGSRVCSNSTIKKWRHRGGTGRIPAFSRIKPTKRSGGAGNRTRVRKTVTGASTCVACVLNHPAIAHRQAVTRLVLLESCAIPEARSTTPATSIDQPTGTGDLLIRPLLRFLRPLQRTELRCRWQLFVPIWIYEVVGPLDTRHQPRCPRRNLSPPGAQSVLGYY